MFLKDKVYTGFRTNAHVHIQIQLVCDENKSQNVIFFIHYLLSERTIYNSRVKYAPIIFKLKNVFKSAYYIQLIAVIVFILTYKDKADEQLSFTKLSWPQG